MNEFSVPMALVDVIPVVLFFLAGQTMMKWCYGKLNRTEFSLLSGGVWLLFFGAVCKLVWKFLYVFGVCDYTTFTEAFFPMQSAGFILLGIALTGMFKAVNEKSASAETVTLKCSMIPAMVMIATATGADASLYGVTKTPETISSHMPFLLVTLIAMSYMYVILCIISVKNHKKIVVLTLILSYLGMMVNCFVGSMTGNAGDSLALYHWIAELGHIFAETFLLVSVVRLRKELEN